MAKKLYLVVWEMALEAESPIGAAAEALRIQRDPTSTACEFTVVDDNFVKSIVDLGE